MTAASAREAWLFPLALPPHVLAWLEGLLAPDERRRAAAFRHARDHDRFVARRGQLRLLLAHETAARPEHIRYDCSPLGKPCLAGGGPLQFSTSSADDLGLCVLSRAGEVGCDLAVDRPVPDALAIARRLFSEGEQRALAALPPALRDRGFLNIWTRKEAYLKAIGTGLDHALDRFTVSAADEPTSTIRDARAGWMIATITTAAGYVGALSAKGDVTPLPARPFVPVMAAA